MGMTAMTTALDRILARFDLRDAFATLATRIAGNELTTVLLALVRERATRVTPATLLHRYETDRFTRRASVSYDALRRTEDAAMRAATAFEPCVLSPLAPFGIHSAIAPVDQNKVVTTLRGSEVAADPTNTLALEAAVRRRACLRSSPKSVESFRLAAVQRVVRAQNPAGPLRFAHFHLAGFVSAGRDTGALTFEASALREHLLVHTETALALGAQRVRLALTDIDGHHARAIAAARAALPPDARVECIVDPARTAGIGYYSGLCFKSFATFAGESLEIGDGGETDWTQQLVGSDKERCFISGLGLDRLAAAL
jgi:hypothetical protein